LQSFADKETALANSFAGTANANDIARGVQFGQDIAAAIIEWSTHDGYTLWNDCTYTAPVGVGLWSPTPPAFSPNPLEPCWGSLRPFVLGFSTDCAPIPFPAFTLAAGWPFAVEAQEVYDTVNNLTTDQQDIARFWADGAGTLTPPGHWVSITGQILAQLNSTL